MVVGDDVTLVVVDPAGTVGGLARRVVAIPVAALSPWSFWPLAAVLVGKQILHVRLFLFEGHARAKEEAVVSGCRRPAGGSRW